MTKFWDMDKKFHFGSFYSQNWFFSKSWAVILSILVVGQFQCPRDTGVSDLNYFLITPQLIFLSIVNIYPVGYSTLLRGQNGKSHSIFWDTGSITLNCSKCLPCGLVHYYKVKIGKAHTIFWDTHLITLNCPLLNLPFYSKCCHGLLHYYKVNSPIQYFEIQAKYP